MTGQAALWDSGERVPAEAHNTLHLELLSAYAVARRLGRRGIALDAGCGSGAGACHLADAGLWVLAIDYEAEVARVAAQRGRRRRLAAACMDAMAFGLRNACIDLACGFQIIEHVPDAERFVAEFARVLRPSGLAILSTPNALTHRGPRNPFHVHEFAPEGLAALLRRHFPFVALAGQRRPSEVYALEAACQRLRRRDVLGLRRLVPRRLVSLGVLALAVWNGLTPPQRMDLGRFEITERTDDAYNLFALCGHAPLPEGALTAVDRD